MTNKNQQHAGISVLEPWADVDSIADLRELTTVPQQTVKRSGTALVIGSAWTAFDDVNKALELRPDAALIGINRTPIDIKCEMMVSIDRTEKIKKWKESAVKKFGPIELHSISGRYVLDFIDYVWGQLKSQGTSELLATQVAIALGFDEVILCGCPLEKGPYLDGDAGWSDKKDELLEKNRWWWKHKAFLHPVTRSMSGWTEKLLGNPL